MATAVPNAVGAVLGLLSGRVRKRLPAWTESPWPSELFQQDGTGQVSPFSGYRFSLVAVSTEPTTPADQGYRPLKEQRGVTSTIEARWSMTVPVDGGADPVYLVYEEEHRLIDALTRPDDTQVRTLWLRATRAVQDTGWVVGTLTLQVHHTIERTA